MLSLISNPSQLLQAALTSPIFDQVQRRIFRQLMESLIYEDLIQTKCNNGNGSLHYIFYGKTNEGEAVRYQVEGRIAFSFNRVKLDENSIVKFGSDGAETNLSIIDFVLEISEALGTTESYIKRLIHELELTLVNDVVAQFVRQKQKRILRNQSYDAIETALSDGHPYHPCYKSRVGFNMDDNLAYAPEFGYSIYPVLLAAHKDIAAIAHTKHITPSAFFQDELSPSLLAHFHEKITEFDSLLAEYCLIPVHPWQWQNIISRNYTEYFNSGKLIYLGELEDCYLAQQSIRTLANHTHPEKCYIKCAMSIQNTSSSRILAPHTIKNAPIVSDWLMALHRNDPYLFQDLRLILLPEIVGITIHLPGSGGADVNYGALSCIWRESLIPHLDDNEAALPFSAISSMDGDGLPIIHQWINTHSIKVWVTAFLKVTTLPLIHLLYHHGVALEAHGQNAVLVHENGLPVRLALKDFHDGIRYVPSLLKEKGKTPQIHAVPSNHQNINRNSYIEIEDPAYLRDFLLDAVYFINLSEIAMFLDKHYQFPEQTYWTITRDIILDYQAANKDLEDRFDHLDLFVQTIEVEQLTKRRLFPDDGNRSHQVPNPLRIENVSVS